MEKEARVFLLSNKKGHYDMLTKHGFSNIIWYKTTPEFLSSISNNPCLFKDVDLVFIRDIFYEGKNGRKIYDKVYKEAYLGSIPYIEISSEGYMFLTKRVARNNMSEKDIFSILSLFKFSKDNRETHLIAKEQQLLNVLFVGESSIFPFVESYFISQGFGSVSCVNDIDLRDEETIKDVASYDIVISGNKKNLTGYADKLSSYLLDKEHLLYLVSFNIDHLNDASLAHLDLVDTLSCEENRKTIYTYRDYNKLHQYILDVVMEEYSKINGDVTFKNTKTFNEIIDEYIEHRSSVQEETERIREKIFVIDEIEHLSRIFMRSHVRRDKVREIDGIRFERLDNGISVAFIHEGMILARITYNSDGKNLESPYYKEFNLEVQNSKGYLMNLGMRSIYDDRKQIKQDAPPVIRDDDYMKVEGIYKKLLSLLKKKNKEKTLKLK